MNDALSASLNAQIFSILTFLFIYKLNFLLHIRYNLFTLIVIYASIITLRTNLSTNDHNKKFK